ncbi:MAG: endonuclease/exonuclease/phosphatase family protein [Pseudomonadota bacterium]
MLDGIRGLIALAAAVGIVLSLASFFGARHPAFDTLAAFRVHLGLGFGALILFAVAFAARTAALIALTGLVVAGAGVAPALLPDTPLGLGDLRLYSQNLNYRNASLDAVATGVEAVAPDIIVLQEVNEANRALLEDLRGTYRTQTLCAFSDTVGGVAVAARFQQVGPPGCARGQGAGWLRLRTPVGDVTVVSLHAPWPWPYGRQAEQAKRLSQILGDLPEPILIAGDFNNAPWADSVRRIATATGTRVVPGLRLTLDKAEFWPGLPIDHVLVSEDLVAETRTLGTYGSDHRALLTQFRFR